MTNTFLEDVISGETTSILDDLLAIDSSNFVEQVRIARLDKKNDFLHSDLRNVCFDDSDLRGFDFTGADLEGATGKNTLWDHTTRLIGANISGSLFAYETAKATFFSQEPTWHTFFLRKVKEHWAHNINWFSDRLSERGQNHVYLVEVAKAICDTTNDSFLRAELMLALAPTFSSSLLHREFLFHNLAKHSNDAMFVRSTIRVISALYSNDPVCFEILRREISNPDYTVRDAAIRGIIGSKLLKNEISTLSSEIMRFSSDIRRNYVYRSAQLVHTSIVNAVIEPSGHRALDFAEPISDIMIERIARARLMSEGQKRLAGRRAQTGEPMQPNVSERQVLERAVVYRHYLKVLQQQGVPFTFA